MALNDLEFVRVNLGERINKFNIFNFTVPRSPVRDNDTLPPDSSASAFAFYGIDNNEYIKRVTYSVYNYTHIYQLDGHLENNVWRLSPEPIKLTDLLEYSDQLQLRVEIELSIAKRKFYQFTAVYVKSNSNNPVVYQIKTYHKDYLIQFVSKIWRVVINHEHSNDDHKVCLV